MMHIYNITPFLPILGAWGTLARPGSHTHPLTGGPPTIEIGQLHTNNNREGGGISNRKRELGRQKRWKRQPHCHVLSPHCATPGSTGTEYIISFNFHSNPLRWVLLLSLLASQETRDLDGWSHLTKILNGACTAPKL